jgi:hypothetical protein
MMSRGDHVIVPYTGNAAYCFSNSLHMCLLGSAHGHRSIPGPGFLECLSGMTFGNSYGERSGRFFPSAPGFTPEKGGGLALAIHTLGWTCETWHAASLDGETCGEEAGGEAVERLREALKGGPVLLGPLDFGYLSHYRGSGGMTGFDHYVVGLSLDEDGLLLHDPAGLPFAVLPVADLLPAWQAERIGFKCGSYTLRSHFKLARHVTPREMIELTLPVARQNTLIDPGGPDTFGGGQALARLARRLRGSVTEEQEAHALGFSMPTAARRSLDAACFLKEGGRVDASELMRQRSVRWGRACSVAARRQWDRAADILEELAEIEPKLAAAL